LASSYLMCPIAAPCRITQGMHFYNAVDFSHSKCGEPIYAAAAGQVIKVKFTSSTSKWAFGGAGNTIAIMHPNGVVTSYGHLQAGFVNVGDSVYQGQIIALMGGQPGTAGAGNTTGCHVHFGVSGAYNSFAK
jgi:murein DD-endopeptidase MepM/ murein hydrolase activator NlpD